MNTGTIVREIQLANNALKSSDNEMSVYCAQPDALLQDCALPGFNRLLQLQPQKGVLFFTTVISSKHFAGIIAELLDDNDLIAEIFGNKNGIILVVTKCSQEVFYDILGIIPDRLSSSFFSEHELIINPTVSIMALTHSVATPEDLAMLREWGIENRALPILLMKDVQRRWHDFSPGQVVVVSRGNSNYYRIVK